MKYNFRKMLCYRTEWTVNLWNSLPEDVVKTKTLTGFNTEAASVTYEECDGPEEMTEPLKQCTAWLQAYFCEPWMTKKLPMPPFHHPVFEQDSFTRQVLWTLLRDVKFGEAVSYKQLADLAGNSNAARAVGGAMRSNPGKKQEFSHLNLLLPLLWMLLLHCSLRAKLGTFLGNSNYISFCTKLHCYSLRTVSCRFALYCLVLMYTILYWKAIYHIKISCIVKYSTVYLQNMVFCVCRLFHMKVSYAIIKFLICFLYCIFKLHKHIIRHIFHCALANCLKMIFFNEGG
ncbi:methylated-DNA--protein-cysteine methyltransferase isoform X4 [Pelodiscus sinensis]|uniref:methylated-DNA--protein-cysteine methyltransferase isoform X4 n=1 Tax=Pelodiscus sinensis TaxID=13735 RepID=UPI003F6D087E